MRYVFAIAALFWACAAPASADPLGSWRGTYFCEGANSNFTLNLRRATANRIFGEFEYAMANGVSGSFAVEGRSDAEGNSRIWPIRWIQRPENHVAIALEGRFSGDTFAGRVDHPSCAQFSMQRQATIAAMPTQPNGGGAGMLPLPRSLANRPPGVAASVLNAARPIGTLQSRHFQPNPPSTPDMPVYVAGRRKAYIIQPFTAYDPPLAGPELATANFPFYTPADTPELSEHAALPYAGRHDHVVSEQTDGSETRWATIDFAVPLPGLAYAFPRLYGPPDIWAIDGWFFRSREDMDHYLRRQPPGRVVEFIMYGSNARRQNTVFVLYAPLVEASAAQQQQAAAVSENAPRLREDVLADFIAGVAAPTIMRAFDSGMRGRTWQEWWADRENASRLCREAGGICP